MWRPLRSRRPGCLVLWGLDLGLTFATWLTFSGVWVLAAVAVVSADMAFGAVLFEAFWCGRALSVWVAPLLVERATDTRLLAALVSERSLFRAIHVGGLICTVLVAGSWIATGTAM